MPNRKATVKPAKLDIWQQRLADSDVAWKPETDRMDHREHLYNGDRKIRPLVTGDTQADGGQENTPHVRNVVFENIESQVSAAAAGRRGSGEQDRAFPAERAGPTAI